MIWEALGDYHGPPLIKAFGRYVMARFAREIIDRSYRMYVTDSLQMIPQLSYLSVRWSDIMYGEPPKDIDTDEVIDSVLSRLEE